MKVHDDETVADKIPRVAANLVEEAVGHFDRSIVLCLRACVVDVGRTYRFLVGAGLRLFASPALIPVVFLRLETKPIGFLPHVQAYMILCLDFNSDHAAGLVERGGEINRVTSDQGVVLTRLIILKMHATQTVGAGYAGFPIAPILKRLIGRSDA